MPASHALFCYGTLCIPAIMRAVAGHKALPAAAQLPGYQSVCLRGRRFPGIVARTGAQTEGMLYRGLTPAQLRRLDRYEDTLYVRRRVSVNTVQGRAVEAWTYVLHPRYYRLINRQPWSLAVFRARYQAAYEHRHGW